MSTPITFRKHVVGRNFEEIVDLAESEEFREKENTPGSKWVREVYYVSDQYDFDILVAYDEEGPGVAFVIPKRKGAEASEGGVLRRED